MLAKGHDLNFFQKFFLVFLRTIIGWHMLSEGIGKVRMVDWTPTAYLEGSFGPLAPYFQLIPQYEWMVAVSAFCVTWGLVACGIMLLTGTFTRLGCLIGIGLLTLFYVSMPPWEWIPQPETESNYLIVNKNLVEMFALWVIVCFPTGRFAGLDALLYPMIGKYFPKLVVGLPSNEA